MPESCRPPGFSMAERDFGGDVIAHRHTSTRWSANWKTSPGSSIQRRAPRGHFVHQALQRGERLDEPGRTGVLDAGTIQLRKPPPRQAGQPVPPPRRAPAPATIAMARPPQRARGPPPARAHAARASRRKRRTHTPVRAIPPRKMRSDKGTRRTPELGTVLPRRRPVRIHEQFRLAPGHCPPWWANAHHRSAHRTKRASWRISTSVSASA